MHYSLDVTETCVDPIRYVDPFGTTFAAAGITWTVEGRDPVAISGTSPGGAFVRLENVTNKFGMIRATIDGHDAGTYDRSTDVPDLSLRTLLDRVARAIRVLNRDAIAGAHEEIKAERPSRIAAILAAFAVEGLFGPAADGPVVTASRLLETPRARSFALGLAKAEIRRGNWIRLEFGPRHPESIEFQRPWRTELAGTAERPVFDVCIAGWRVPGAGDTWCTRSEQYDVAPVVVTDRVDGGYEVTSSDPRVAAIAAQVLARVGARQATYLAKVDADRAAALAEAQRRCAVYASSRAEARARQAAEARLEGEDRAARMVIVAALAIRL